MNLDAQISWYAQYSLDLETQISQEAQYMWTLKFEVPILWQAQHFVDLDAQISWQAQYFVGLEVLKRRFRSGPSIQGFVTGDFFLYLEVAHFAAVFVVQVSWQP